eukprot:scaffold66323_cov19-Tisochrysis_lutea.AAC.5
MESSLCTCTAKDAAGRAQSDGPQSSLRARPVPCGPWMHAGSSALACKLALAGRLGYQAD